VLHNPNAASGRGAIAKFHIKRDTTAAPLDGDRREHYLAWAIDHMRRFKRVFGPRLGRAVGVAVSNDVVPAAE
jgi:hypothetical protein